MPNSRQYFPAPTPSAIFEPSAQMSNVLRVATIPLCQPFLSKFTLNRQR